MEFILYYGIVLLLVSLVIIFKPNVIIRLNKATDKVVFTDSNLFRNPFVSGVIFIVLGCLLVYIGFGMM
ncbi:hypothetical protein ACFL67_03800 [candidate division KSB1 bacterium]